MKVIALFTPLLAFSLFIIQPNFKTDHDILPTKEEGKVTFDEFIDGFEKTGLPYEVNRTKFEKVHEDRKFENEIPHEMLDFLPFERRRFSRVGPDDYTFEELLVDTDDIKIIVVGSKMPFSEQLEACHLVVYKNDEPTAHKRIAFSYGSYKYMTAKVGNDLTVTIKEWEVDKMKKSDNEAASSIVNVQRYQINEVGEFEEKKYKPYQKPSLQQTNVPQDARASLD